MTDNADQLEFKKPLIILSIVFVFIILLSFLFSNLDKKRKEAIVQKYTTEVATYLKKNQTGLETIFRCLPYSTPVDPSCPSGRQSEISSLITSDLKDFSSTMFIKKTNTGKIITIKLSQEIADFSNYPPEKYELVGKLLDGQLSELPWDDYLFDLSGKEVIVPFKSSQGKILGALARGVIE